MKYLEGAVKGLFSGLSSVLKVQAKAPKCNQNSLIIIGVVLVILVLGILSINVFQEQPALSVGLYASVVWVMLYVLKYENNYRMLKRKYVRTFKENKKLKKIIAYLRR